MSTIVIVGETGAGKSTLENELHKKGYKKIISYTTRTPRPDEANGVDYWFINNDTFKEMINLGLFAEYEEYSNGRFYGTLKTDYYDETINKVVVLTPNGLRQIRKNLNNDIYAVYITASLGTRMKRYIDRLGNNFSYSEKDELSSRVERDFGAFLGVENDVDLVINNDGKNIKDIVSDILNE